MFTALVIASQVVGLTGSSAAWTAIATVITALVVVAGIGAKLIANFSRLTDSVERLNRNIEIITSQVGGHEHRISMLEGRSFREEIPPPAAVIYPVNPPQK